MKNRREKQNRQYTQTSSDVSFASIAAFLFPGMVCLPILNLRVAIVSKSYCWMKTFAFVSPRAFVYLFLLSRFLSRFYTFGFLQASLNKSAAAILSRRKHMLKEGPTSRKGTVFIYTFASVTSSHSKCLNSIGSFSPREVNTITRLSS